MCTRVSEEKKDINICEDLEVKVDLIKLVKNKSVRKSNTDSADSCFTKVR